MNVYDLVQYSEQDLTGEALYWLYNKVKYS